MDCGRPQIHGLTTTRTRAPVEMLPEDELALKGAANIMDRLQCGKSAMTESVPAIISSTTSPVASLFSLFPFRHRAGALAAARRPTPHPLVQGRWAALLLCAALAACAQQTPRPGAEGVPAASAVQTAGDGTAAGITPPEAAPAAANAGDPPAETVAAPEIPDTDRIFFASNATAVDEAGRRKLRAHAERLKANRRLSVTLVGHTDHLGSRSYNLAIAERRTAEVAEVLTSLGVGRMQIRRYGVGSEKPGPRCQTTECRGRMRRVDLIYPD